MYHATRFTPQHSFAAHMTVCRTVDGVSTAAGNIAARCGRLVGDETTKSHKRIFPSRARTFTSTYRIPWWKRFHSLKTDFLIPAEFADACVKGGDERKVGIERPHSVVSGYCSDAHQAFVILKQITLLAWQLD